MAEALIARSLEELAGLVGETKAREVAAESAGDEGVLLTHGFVDEGRAIVYAPTSSDENETIRKSSIAHTTAWLSRGLERRESLTSSTPLRSLGRVAPRARSRRSTRARLKTRGSPSSADDVPLDATAPGGAR